MKRRSEFITPLVIRMLPESSPQSWQLVEELVYYSAKLQREIRVPVGFVTDLVSFEPLKGIGQRPAVIHDYLCETWHKERRKADKVFLEALHVAGVNEILAHEMYLAVRAYSILTRK